MLTSQQASYRNLNEIIKSKFDDYANEVIPEMESIVKGKMENRAAKMDNHTSIRRIGSIMKAKPTAKEKETCKPTYDIDFEPSMIPTYKKAFCTGYKAIDLSNPKVRNIALYYLKKTIHEKLLNDDKNMN